MYFFILAYTRILGREHSTTKNAIKRQAMLQDKLFRLHEIS